jgi:hypothetical protein
MPAPASRRDDGPIGSLLVVEALVLTLLICLIFDVWHRDLHVPLEFSRDAMEYLIQAKGTLENGWWWSHPRLSAPLSFQQIAYPSNSNVDQLVVLLIGLFTRDVGLCMNLSWAIFVVASGLIATLCLLRLGVSRPSAFVAGALYAISPYALWRSTGHLALVTYLVPVPATAALLVATGRMGRMWQRSSLPFAIGCALLGFDYVYYAFFASVVVLVAVVIAAAKDRHSAAWRTGLGLVGVMALASLVNLSPSFVAWQRDGKPLAIQDKLVSESETNGLKLRHLVGPVGAPDVSLFARWSYLEEGAHFPGEGENTASRLGVVGTFGLFALFWWLLVRRDASGDAHSASRNTAAQLTCAMILFGTVGGAGSLFSLLLSSDIRAYNRVFPFIDFFCLFAVAVLIEDVVERPLLKYGPKRRTVVAACILLLGTLDQSHAAHFLNVAYGSERAEFAAVQSVVGDLEERLRPGAMVFQLPVESFPTDEGLGKTLPYDQAKPYVVSRTLRWSFPAFADGLAKWQREVAALPPEQMGAAVRAEGFSAILVDRRGFDDDARDLVDGLRRVRPEAVLVESARYVAFDVTGAPVEGESAEAPKVSTEARPASAGLAWCPGSGAYSIDRIGSVVAPFDHLPVQAPFFGDLTITGWAVDIHAGRPARDVDVVVGDSVFPAFYGLIRQDVSRALNLPHDEYVGFTTRIPRGDLPSGTSKLSIRVVAPSGACYYETNPIPISVP